MVFLVLAGLSTTIVPKVVLHLCARIVAERIGEEVLPGIKPLAMASPKQCCSDRSQESQSDQMAMDSFHQMSTASFPHEAQTMSATVADLSAPRHSSSPSRIKSNQ